MNQTIYKLFFLIILAFSCDPLWSSEEIIKFDSKEVIHFEPEVFDETCLDEYATRNAYLKKFIVWAPPTLILSLPILSQTYLIAMIGWAILPIEYLNATIVTAFLIPPAVIGAVIALETKNTIEYFGNRLIINVVDALRMGDYQNRFVKILLNKFRQKYPQSNLTRDEFFAEILRLDKSGDLCNGYLTNSNSLKLKKLIAKKRHLLKYLSELK